MKDSTITKDLISPTVRKEHSPTRLTSSFLTHLTLRIMLKCCAKRGAHSLPENTISNQVTGWTIPRTGSTIGTFSEMKRTYTHITKNICSITVIISVFWSLHKSSRRAWIQTMQRYSSGISIITTTSTIQATLKKARTMLKLFSLRLRRVSAMSTRHQWYFLQELRVSLHATARATT